jgi:hypothetical protein
MLKKPLIICQLYATIKFTNGSYSQMDYLQRIKFN